MTNIQKIRKEKGLTQLEVANSIGFGQHAVSTWENGRREPDISTLIKLADFFECSVDDLVGYYKNQYRKSGLSEKQLEVMAYVEKLDEDQCELAKKLLKALLDERK